MTDDRTPPDGPLDIRALMDAANPVPPRMVAGLAETAAARDALRRILAPRARLQPSPRPRYSRGALVSVVAALVVVAVALAVSPAPEPGWMDDAMRSMAPVASEVYLPDQDGSPRMIKSCASPPPGVAPSPRPALPDLSGYPAAGPVLTGLSRTASRQPARERRPEERYSRIGTAEWSTDVQVASAVTSTRVVPREVRRWVPVDGSGAYTEREGPEVERRPAPTGVPWATEAPDDAEGVRRWLLAPVPDGAGEMRRLAEAVARVYRYNTVPPRLAGLIWAVLADRAELRALGDMADRWRRAGTAVAFDLPGERWVFVAGRTTGRLLALERVLLEADPEMNVSAPCSAGYFLLDSSTWTVSSG